MSVIKDGANRIQVCRTPVYARECTCLHALHLKSVSG